MFEDHAPAILLYGTAVLAVWIPYFLRRRRRHRRSEAVLEEARGAGLMEPASLHPLIDKSRCLDVEPA